ncbi:hypothetical protein [Caudoviricetes sp.]|nr:hypothetical protein [Caudoviricetes sp.]
MVFVEKNYGYIPEIPKTLYTGEVVNCDDERWREECEARGLLKKPLAERRAYLNKIKPARAESLKKVMSAIFYQEKENKVNQN